MKLLVAVEDPLVARRAGSHLARCGHSVTITSDVNEAIALISSHAPPTLVVLGSSFAGVALWRSEGETTDARPHPYLLLYRDDATVVEHETLEVGAGIDDVLSYPSSLEELEARVRLAARIVSLEGETASAQEWVLFTATHDPVTGALTRSALLDALDREIARSERESGSIGVIALHIVEAEAVRVSHGSVAYDLLLNEISCRVRDALRTYDLVGRAGADSLITVVPGVDEESAERIALRIRSHLEAAPYDLGVASVNITCRFGITVAMGGQPYDSSSLCAKAEEGVLVTRAPLNGHSESRHRLAKRHPSNAPTLRVKWGSLS